jgi:hypothetical protein
MADGTWHMLFATKQTTAHGATVAAVGHATTRNPLRGRWTIERPLRGLGGTSGSAPSIAGQIELPVLISHDGMNYLFMSQSVAVDGRWTRSVIAYRSRGLDGWEPVPGGATILGPETGLYGLNVLPDPDRPGEFLGHAFFNEGPRAMQPTQVRPIHFEGGRPTISFPDAPWNAADPY